jgi:hypothetical protein
MQQPAGDHFYAAGTIYKLNAQQQGHASLLL